MNRNYYEFIFKGDQGKEIILKITNAKELDIENIKSEIKSDMDEIINLSVLKSSAGKPIARKSMRYIKPETIKIDTENIYE